MTLKEKQLAFLNETIAHYNSKNRCVDLKLGCVYAPTQTSAGCAIGRHLPLELAQGFDQLAKDNQGCPDGIGWGVSADRIYSKLPESLKELGMTFLARMQSLHDNENNWDSDGLNAPYGKQNVAEIVRDFELQVN